MKYNNDNIFAKILRKEIPAKIIYEDDFALAFHDIAPQAPIHILIIPKGPYSCFSTFIAQASPNEIIGFYKAVYQVIQNLGIEQEGFRVLFNQGMNGGQEVPHYHVHIFAGKRLGRMISQ